MEIVNLVPLPDGKSLRGYEVEVESAQENWSEYVLSDGTKVRAKHTLLKAFRIVDEDGNNLFDDFGEPQVFIHGTVIITTKKAKEQK